MSHNRDTRLDFSTIVIGEFVVFMHKTSTNDLFVKIRRGRVPEKNDQWKFSTIVEEEIPLKAVYYPRVGMQNFFTECKHGG